MSSDSHKSLDYMNFSEFVSLHTSRDIKFATKHTEVVSSMCHGVRLALLIPKMFLFSILDLAKQCL